MTIARRRRLRRVWNSLILVLLPGALCAAYAAGMLLAALIH